MPQYTVAWTDGRFKDGCVCGLGSFLSLLRHHPVAFLFFAPWSCGLSAKTLLRHHPVAVPAFEGEHEHVHALRRLTQRTG